MNLSITRCQEHHIHVYHKAQICLKNLNQLDISSDVSLDIDRYSRFESDRKEDLIVNEPLNLFMLVLTGMPSAGSSSFTRNHYNPPFLVRATRLGWWRAAGAVSGLLPSAFAFGFLRLGSLFSHGPTFPREWEALLPIDTRYTEQTLAVVPAAIWKLSCLAVCAGRLCTLPWPQRILGRERCHSWGWWWILLVSLWVFHPCSKMVFCCLNTAHNPKCFYRQRHPQGYAVWRSWEPKRYCWGNISRCEETLENKIWGET